MKFICVLFSLFVFSVSAHANIATFTISNPSIARAYYQLVGIQKYFKSYTNDISSAYGPDDATLSSFDDEVTPNSKIIEKIDIDSGIITFTFKESGRISRLLKGKEIVLSPILKEDSSEILEWDCETDIESASFQGASSHVMDYVLFNPLTDCAY